MPKNIYREKLLNAILFFAQKTRHVNMTKMSKLLYFFDFTHFKQTGYPAIGLEYFAFERGPVPKKLWLQLKDGNVPDDLRGKLALVLKKDELDPQFKEVDFIAKAKPDLAVFSTREKRILEELAFMFKDVKAKEISGISHLPNQPWEITRREKGENAPIDYMLAIDQDAQIDRDEAAHSLQEHREIIKNFGLEPAQ
jgi:uncharacterized phage-associated protein